MARRAGPHEADSRGFEGTTGVTEKQRPTVDVAVLQEVRTARQAGYDRVVFEFQGNEIPGYHVQYVHRPVRECGSGDVVTVTGDGQLEVRFTPAQVHTEIGEVTLKDDVRRPNLLALKELRLTCDFEADVAWVLEVSYPSPYRLLELSHPARVVIDIQH